MCLDTALQLEKQGIEAEIIDMRCLNPMDMDTIRASLEKTNKVILVDEGSLTGGWTAEVGARIGDHFFDLLDGPVVRIGALDVPVPYSPVLVEQVFPNVEKILAGIQRILG